MINNMNDYTLNIVKYFCNVSLYYCLKFYCEELSSDFAKAQKRK
jgi:hypothetical protein